MLLLGLWEEMRAGWGLGRQATHSLGTEQPPGAAQGLQGWGCCCQGTACPPASALSTYEERTEAHVDARSTSHAILPDPVGCGSIKSPRNSLALPCCAPAWMWPQLSARRLPAPAQMCWQPAGENAGINHPSGLLLAGLWRGSCHHHPSHLPGWAPSCGHVGGSEGQPQPTAPLQPSLQASPRRAAGNACSDKPGSPLPPWARAGPAAEARLSVVRYF